MDGTLSQRHTHARGSNRRMFLSPVERSREHSSVILTNFGRIPSRKCGETKVWACDIERENDNEKGERFVFGAAPGSRRVCNIIAIPQRSRFQSTRCARGRNYPYQHAGNCKTLCLCTVGREGVENTSQSGSDLLCFVMEMSTKVPEFHTKILHRCKVVVKLKCRLRGALKIPTKYKNLNEFIDWSLTF